MPVRRRRGMRARGGRRYIGKLRTAVVNVVFEIEAMNVAGYIPSSTSFSSFNDSTQGLPMSQTNSGGQQAVMWAINMSMNWLSTYNPSNYRFISQLYDYIRLKCVDVILRPLIDPRKAVVTTNQGSTAYNFATYPQNDPVVTLIDYDGWNPMLAVNSATPINCPPNGDMTQQLMNRLGARRHDPWKVIRRRFVPRTCTLVASIQATQPFVTGPGLVQGKRAGWMTTNNQGMWLGQMYIAIPYLGQQLSGGFINNQPTGLYSIANKWYLAFKSPLYG